MKIKPIALFLILFALTSCSHPSHMAKSLQTKWKKLKSIWGEDQEGMLASGGFYGPLEEEFIPLEEDDLHMQFAESVIAQPKDVPGENGLPSLNQFKKAFAHLAHLFQNVYFNTDDYMLRRPEYLAKIDKMATYLKKHPNTYISVEGHCDERGSEAYNLALGTRRSNYIRSLFAQRGVNPNQVHTISYGKEQPIDLGHNASSWARNRRVEFKLYEK